MRAARKFWRRHVMDWLDKLLDLLGKFPDLLNQYGGLPYPVLAVLLVPGLAIVGWVLFKRKEGLSAPAIVTGVMLIVLSASSFLLKKAAEAAEERAKQAYYKKYRAPTGEHRLIVSDFSFPGPANEVQGARMKMLVFAISEVLLEDIPDGFPKPRVVQAPKEGSPWREGIGPNNYDEVIRELNAFELIWGEVHEGGKLAKIFLGLSQKIAEEFDKVVPLKDFPFEDNPRLKHQFGDGYYRLLGLVTLGLVLDTYQRATQASGDQRKALFLKASEQLRQARARLNNNRNDTILKRNLFNN